MAGPTITFNSGTGSDTAASGAGPATALSGIGASLAASTSVDLSADSPDLSGVAVDGSACMWVSSSSGIQFSKITAIDNVTKVVTVEKAYGVTESSRTWGIGGKRATIDNADSRHVFREWTAEWTIVFEDDQSVTGTAIDIEHNSTSNNSSSVTIKSDSTTVRTLTQSANAAVFQNGSVSNKWTVRFEYLKFECTNATRTAAYAFNINGTVNGSIDSRYLFLGCVLGDATNKLTKGIFGNGGVFCLVDSSINNCTSRGIDITFPVVNLSSCQIKDNGAEGVYLNNAAINSCSAINCLITGNTLDGIKSREENFSSIFGCTIHNNGGDGIDLTIASEDSQTQIVNNNITGNGGDGIRRSNNSLEDYGVVVDYNNFGTGATANTSGDVLGPTKGPNNLSVDPQYTATGSDDYSVGANVKAKGLPDVARTIGANQSGTTSYVDIGAAQRQEPAGGGGGTTIISRPRRVM